MFLLSVIFSLLLVACQTGTDESVSKPVIIDTDMGTDDWLAMLYLLQRPELSVKAITVTGTGLAHCEPGTQNALGLVALAEQSDIPVTCGRETPLKSNHVFPEDWRTEADEMLGLTLPDNPNTVSEQNSVELLISTVNASQGQIIVVALGPLTNVAEALQQDSTLAGKIKMVYVMGGAVDVPGNIADSGADIDNTTAEWNIYADPHAANIVFQSGVPVTLVPLDATNHVPLSAEFYEKIKQDHTTPEATFAFNALTGIKGYIDEGWYYFWDPVAAVVASDESVVTIETRTLVVIEEEGSDSGRTQTVDDGAEVRVAVSADAEKFKEIFLNTLNVH